MLQNQALKLVTSFCPIRNLKAEIFIFSGGLIEKSSVPLMNLNNFGRFHILACNF